MGNSMADKRCPCGPYGHDGNLGKDIHGNFTTAGSGSYPLGMIVSMASDVGAWFAERRSLPLPPDLIASMQARAAAVVRPRGATRGPLYQGFELILITHVQLFHASELVIREYLRHRNLSHRVNEED
jgi:hypothetical protein